MTADQVTLIDWDESHVDVDDLDLVLPYNAAPGFPTYGVSVLDRADVGLIAEQFGLGEDACLQGPVAYGRLGEIWQLVTGRGRFAVKHAHVAVSVEDAELDAAYQDVVRSAGVPMPAVVRTVDGTVVADIGGARVRVYEWVDVLPADRRLDPGELGRLLASIHAAAVPTDDAIDGWYADPVGAEAWQELLGRLRGAEAPFAERLAALLPRVVEAEGILASPRRVQICHRDLWADNVRRARDGGLVVLDWENCGAGDVNGELGCALFEYGLGERDRMRILYAAYVEAGGPGRLAGRGDLTMLVAQLGNIARIGCERWLTSSTDQERARNVDWVTEFLDEPVTVETVDRILRAVNG
ncbi:MAG: aminoglycoside phosphotransferase family protein [Nocardioides sp.]